MWIDGWSVRRRALAIALFVLVLLALAAAPRARDYARATLLFAEGIIGASGPLRWWADEPTTIPVHWNGGFGQLTLPAGDDRVPGVVLVLGADPAPPEDPRVRQLISTLARLDIAVLLPLSEQLVSARVEPGGVAQIVDAVAQLRDQPRVRGQAVGLAGLSAGASLALVAAADHRVASDVAFVLAVGPYWNARSLVASVASTSYRRPNGDVVPWRPHQTTVEVVRNTLALHLSDEEVDDILAPASLVEAEQRVAALPPAAQASLDAVSPAAFAADLVVPIYLLHDRGDEFIPWTESETMAALIRPAAYHGIDLFQHVEPAPTSVPVLIRDGWRIVRVLADLLGAFDSPHGSAARPSSIR